MTGLRPFLQPTNLKPGSWIRGSASCTLVFHIASGQSFFTGAGLLIIAAGLSRSSLPLARRCAALGAIIGFIAITVSSTAIPLWCYGCLGVAGTAWLLSAWLPQWRKGTGIAVICVVGLAVVREIPWHIRPQLRPADRRSLTVIGDSVTAGMGENEAHTWPGLYSAAHDVEVQDLSEMGETAGSALKRIRRHEVTGSVVLLEIGGNDLLGGTSAPDYERNLDMLLSELRHPDRQLIMFELPLPPFRHDYGYIQRRLARRHQVALVPKRVFLSILASEDATLDSIHLSQTGHNRMAEHVWELTQPAYEQ